MERALLRQVFLSACLTVAAWPFCTLAETPDRYAPRQIIVRIDPAAAPGDALILQKSLNAVVKRRFESIGAELWEISGSVPDAVDRLARDARVEYAEPNYVIQADDLFPDDPRFVQSWGLHNTGQTGGKLDADIDAPEAWSEVTGGSVLVGVVDTGIDRNHVELAGNIFTNTAEVPSNGIDDDQNGFVDDVHGWDFFNNDNDPSDDNGHGTHVAGIIAARGNNGIGVAGVSWSARLLPLKVLGSDGRGTVADAVPALHYATQMGVRLTNNSWGSNTNSVALRAAIIEAASHHILVVASAGNSSGNSDVFPVYPAAHDLDNIISVASTDRNDALSWFSNYGAASVDLAAPGSNILSTFRNDTYRAISGTSMAGAHVSGAACLLWTRAPLMTGLEVKHALLSTVDKLPSLAGKVASGGRLNVHRLLSGHDNVAPAPVGNLAVESTGSSSAHITWFATGDDGAAGTARSYDLRYARFAINSNNFNAATRVLGTKHPSAAGAFESFEIAGLGFHSTYYFALIVEDELGNRSPMSNVASGTTLGVPLLDYTPDSFPASLHTGGTHTQRLTIDNNGQGTLDFAAQSFPSWVQLRPPLGRVNAGESALVDVVFDAAHLSGGVYTSSVILWTNDPGQASVVFPVSLQVTNAADVSAVSAEKNFGDRFGPCVIDAVVVSNIGKSILHVSGVEIDDGPFYTDPTAFLLNPDESRSLPVVFCPTSLGRWRGTLTVHSNDPDHPAYTVSLTGRAVEPPVISVEPASLSASAFTGGVSTRTISISNSGGSDLDFEISFAESGPGGAVESFGAASLPEDVVAVGRPLAREELNRLRASFPQEVFIGAPDEIDRGKASTKSTTHSMALDRVVGARVEEVFGSAASQFIAPTRTRGNLFTCTKSTNLLEHRFYMAPTAPTEMWFMIYEGESPSGFYALVSASDVSPSGMGPGWYSSGEIHVPMRAGMYYLIVASFEHATSYYLEGNISPYPIPASFGELTGGAGWTWSPSTQFPPSGFQDVFPQAFDEPVAYYQTLVTDGVVKWTSVENESGAVTQGTTKDIEIRFSAAGFADGDHFANLRILSDDPLAPEVLVPTQFHIESAADIGFSQSLLDYGATFVGAAVKDTLVVSNAGTQPLHVTGITSNSPKYTVDISSFTLAPNANINVVVTFTPGTTGEFPGTLTLTSDDPDEPVVAFGVTGLAIEPPVMSMSPSFVTEALASGGTASRTLSISNSGESDLIFGIEIEAVETSSSPGHKPGPDREPEQAASRDITPAGDTPPRASSRHSYSGHATAGSRIYEKPAPKIGALAGNQLQVVIVHNALVFQMRELLMGYPDLSVVDQFDASAITPTLDELDDYDAVVLINDGSFDDPDGLGDVLADYVDQGGGVVVTLAAFIFDFEVAGRFMSGGYSPFSLGTGPIGAAELADYDAAHPIMQGVGSAFGEFLGATLLEPGAQFVANWDNGQPFVATQGDRVAAINAYLADGGYWFGDIPLILHNAIVWTAGTGWLRVEPAQAIVPARTSFDVALMFDAKGLSDGTYNARLLVTGNDPRVPIITVPVSLVVDSTLTVSAAGPIALPTKFALLPNRPNPFNPTTTIAYELPKSAEVRLVVYDVGGRQVRELVSATRPAGRHSVVWDGRNDASVGVASGVYFYRLVAGEFVQTKKMVLLK